MYKTILLLIFKMVTRLIFSITIFHSFNSYAANNTSSFKNETDSLKSIVQQYKTDTDKFKILANYYWKYGNTDPSRVKPIGELAFEVIKNSDNLKCLSDGYDIKGCIYVCQQNINFDSIIYFFQKALDISTSINYRSRMAWSYHNLACVKYTFGNLEDAVSDFKKSIGLFSVGADPSVLFQMNLVIANCYNINNYDSAIVYFNNALSNLNNINNPNKVYKNILTTQICLQLATLYKKKNNKHTAIDFMDRALEILKKTDDDKELGILFHALANFFADNKSLNNAIALDYYNKAYTKSFKYNNTIEQAYIYSQIGNLYLKEGKDSIALLYNLISLGIAEKLKNKRALSIVHKSLGYIYEKLGAYQTAINNFKIFLSTSSYSYENADYYDVMNEVADLYLKLNNRDEALNYYHKVLKVVKYHNAKSSIAMSYFKIGNYYGSVDRQQALEYYLLALTAAEEGKNIAIIKNTADTLSRYYMQKGDYKRVSYYQRLAMAMNDSLVKLDRDATIAETEMEFKVKNESDAKQALSAAEIKRQKVYRNGGMLISGLLVIFGFVVYRSYKRKKRDNKLLVEQKNEIEEKNQEIEAQVEEITAQKNEIERISGALHESDEMKLRFFSNISHELRTPLTLILNPVQNILKSFQGNGELKKQLENIYKNAQRLHDLTNQIMDLQKLDAGKLELNLEKADIVDYCLSITSSFDSLCAKKDNVIRFNTNHRSVYLLFDKDKIGKVLVNLLSNALKFCYEGSVIEACIQISGNNFNMSVADKGIGIPGEQIENVFNRYYQVPSGNQAQGTGIGLAYVKELTGFMKGKVTIDSVLNVGTNVAISIPINGPDIKDAAVFSTDVPKTRKQPTSEEFNLADYNTDENENSVLIVEDNDELRAYIADLLKPGFNIYLAKDGLEGFQLASQRIPDIVISDVMMPGMNGFELCTTLKKDERTSHMPIILLTARDSAQSSLEGYQTGADDYIVKPFDNELLKLKVKNIIATREAARKQFDFKSILSTENIRLGDTDKEFMKKCLAIMESHIDDSAFSVDHLAAELAFSNRNFYRKIKALTNQTPAEFIRIYRLHYAKRLLQNTQMKVFEIAGAVGYEDTNKFRQAFKKQFGISPSESMSKNID